MYYVYDLICESDQTARDLAMCGAALSESEIRRLERLPTHSKYVDTLNGIDIWYDYGADYYFFVEVETLCD